MVTSDAIYVGLTHTQHYSATKAALESGKAVLCEKPLTTSVAKTQSLIETSRKNKTLLVEAMWSAFCPPYLRIRQLVEQCQPICANATFTLAFPPRPPRPDSPEIGYNSSMFGIGIYALHFATTVFGRSPKIVNASGRLDENLVDRGVSVSLHYENKAKEVCLVNLIVDTQTGGPDDCVAMIQCKPGNELGITAIEVGPKFWMPERIAIHKSDGTIEEEKFPLPPLKDQRYAEDEFAFINSHGLAYEADAFADAFAKWKSSGTLEHELRSHADTISDAETIEQILKTVREQNA